MEEQSVVDRCTLRDVWLEHPKWSKRERAQAVGRSRSWVKKWLKRIRGSPREDREMLNGHSRAWKRPPAQVAPEVMERILEIRDHPPQKLGRIPGPLTILYHLKQDQNLTQAGCTLPHSTRTIWKILDRYDRFLRAEPHQHEAEERPEPRVEWGMDFHGVGSVPADPEGKQQHVVETAVVASEPHNDFAAEVALWIVAARS